MAIDRSVLTKLYIEKKLSMTEIAQKFKCSINTVDYWLRKYAIPRRTISEAIYHWHNPKGDPFQWTPPKTNEDYALYGMGIGIYWGEGTKANIYAVRLGNSDPALLKTFLAFLVRFYRIEPKDCRFGLQIFSDMDPSTAMDFWTRALKIHKRQFYKCIVTRTGSIGTYRQKTQYGVLTLYYNNRKLRDHLVAQLATHAAVAQG